MRVLVKATLLFLVFNLLFVITDPMPALGRLSLYNHIFPGRQRLPYGDIPSRAYNLTIDNIDAMFASHEIAHPKTTNEFRVIIVGDSATWGWLLPVEDTISANLNALNLHHPDGRQLNFYNLGYPVMSLTKDLLLLDQAMIYRPDLIIWPVTLESFPKDKQLYPPLLINNPEQATALIQTYGLDLPAFPVEMSTFLNRSLFGARRPLADLIRLQLYGVMWAATGIDQDIPGSYTPLQTDLDPDTGFHGLQPGDSLIDHLAVDALQAGVTNAGQVSVLIINEPMFISSGANHDVRYNFFYPCWAYDTYRAWLSNQARSRGWNYLDLWDIIPPGEFTNSAVHLSPTGSRAFAEQVAQAVQRLLEP